MTSYTKSVLYQCIDASVKVVNGTVCVTSYTKNVLFHCRDASANVANGQFV